MDRILEEAWRARAAPFECTLLVQDDYARIEDLLPALRLTVECLEHSGPEVVLFSLDDWHEHDGLVTTADRCVWSDVYRWLDSPRSLLGACSCDSFVCRALYPDSLEWLLRIDVEDPEDSRRPRDVLARFNLTSQETVCGMFHDLLASFGPARLQLVPAASYFDVRYRGRKETER